MKLSFNGDRRRLHFGLIAFCSVALLGCGSGKPTVDDGDSETSTGVATAVVGEVGFDPELAYQMYFGVPETYTSSNVDFEIDIEMRGYRDAQKCMNASGREFQVPTRDQVRATLYSAQIVDSKSGAAQHDATTSNNTVQNDPMLLLTPECIEAKNAQRNKLEAAIEPFNEPFMDSLMSVQSSPEVEKANEDYVACMTGAGFNVTSHYEFLNEIRDPAPTVQGDATDEAAAEIDKQCYAEPSKVIDAAYQEAADKFGETHHAQVIEAIESVQP